MPSTALAFPTTDGATGVIDPDLRLHFEALGHSSAADYDEWCRRHGFSRRTAKHWRERLKERVFATRDARSSRLRRQRRETRRPDEVICAILAGQLDHDEIALPRWQGICRMAKALPADGRATDPFRELLLRAERDTTLLQERLAFPALGETFGNTFVEGLLALALHADRWLRPLREWRPRSHNARRQFGSLARHLLAEWPVPAFMDSAWFGRDAAAIRRQGWFAHLGRGRNIRTADLPIPFTRRMAHWFSQAPADFTLDGALRWGQIRALGGDERLVRDVVATRLGSCFEHDEFWITVLRFFVDQPPVNRWHAASLVEFLHDRRFGEAGDGPTGPFTLKGRTLASIRRLAAEWRLGERRSPPGDWPPSGIDPFLWQEVVGGVAERIWTIRELRDGRELREEGQALHHCVATYENVCRRGEVSLWTMELESQGKRQKVLTVEVRNRSSRIVQARGPCNAPATRQQREVLRRWALSAGLRLGG